MTRYDEPIETKVNEVIINVGGGVSAATFGDKSLTSL